MARTCTVCSHESRRKIDHAIVFGKSNRAIAGQFGLPRMCIQRHKKHVAEALERASEKRECSIGESILKRHEDLYQRILRLLDLAVKEKNHPACIGYLREARGTLAHLFATSKAVVPKYADQPQVLQEECIKAVRRALGIVDEFKPRDNQVLNGQNGSAGDAARLPGNDEDDAIDPETLP